MSKTLNENIKTYRILNGMSQVNLAEKLHVSKQCVSNWENDNVLPSVDMLVKLADIFSVSTDALLGRNTDDKIDITGLSDEQKTHLRLIINDLREKK